MDKALALNLISDVAGGSWDSKAVDSALKTLVSYANCEGLPNEELEIVSDAICSQKLGSSAVLQLLQCLIPEKRIPDKILRKILKWGISGLGKQGPHVERRCFRWFVGLLQHKLCSKTELQEYYADFHFALLKHKHLDVPACMLLYYLAEPCDAKDAMITPLLAKSKVSGAFSQLNALLSLLRSFNSGLVPGTIPSTALLTPHSSFDIGMKNAAERAQVDDQTPGDQMVLKWNNFQPAKGAAKKKPRLVPSLDYLRRLTTFGGQGDKTCKPIEEIKTAADLGKQLYISAPQQAMSLLSSESGLHVLTFSTSKVQSRLMINIEDCLNQVFLTKVGKEYSLEEKDFLLVSLGALQEYTRQSISVVSRFLGRYLLIWNGSDHFRQIHALMEWFSFETVDEWELVAMALRVYFRSSRMDDRCSMLRSLAIMLRNTIFSSSGLQILPDNNNAIDPGDVFAAVGALVEELVDESLTWTNHSRQLISEALDFYHSAHVWEQEGHLTVMVMAPSSLVYHSLLSSSRFCIEKLCSLLIKYATLTKERLERLSVFKCFETNFTMRLGIYIMDCYRALFGGLHFQRNIDPGFFSDEMMANLNSHGILTGAPDALRVDKNFAWWHVNESGDVAPMDAKTLARDYPGVMQVKKFVEENL